VVEAVRSALVIVTCLIAAACSATGPDLRPRESGFAIGAGVVDPYEDGKRHLADGRYQLATERFGQALANDRRSLHALNGLAVAYTRLGRFDIAETYFERALQIDATSALTLNNYGWSLVEQGRLREAKPFLELALHRAAEADVPVVAANIESMGQARPPALIAALEKGSPPEAASGHRFIRLAANVYRLETNAGLGGPPEPATVADDAPLSQMALRRHPAAVVSPEEARRRAEPIIDSLAGTEGIGLASAAQASAEHSAAVAPDLDPPVSRQFDDAPLESRPEPVPASEAAAILPGEKT
jgi:tetratricopeptide (TPR) repeat protein